MKKIKHILVLVMGLSVFSACSDWLQLLPQNQQVSDTYWTSQEDVEAVLNAGYLYLRGMVQDQLIPLGELRGGSLFSIKTNKLQSFQVKPTDEAICDWGSFYQIINVANVVLANASKSQRNDGTYEKEEMNAHYCEAYFLRALCYFYLVRNWREVPLLTVPFEDDSHTYEVAKASEADIVHQIKADIKAALATGASKESYTTTWETKGRATKWAFYALMADVCLWSEDYDGAIQYCDFLLESPSSKAPKFLSTPSHNKWFSMFNPGNSNESIFEIQWNYQEGQTNSLPVLFDNVNASRLYQISSQLLLEFNAEYSYTRENLTEAVRTMNGGYYTDVAADAYEAATKGFVWKYCGSKTLSDKRTQTYYDPNFILYRVAEVYLMKAEALILRSESAEDWEAAIELINIIRRRSNLEEREYSEDLKEKDLLEMVLYERRLELVGEGKCWYDELRFGRRNNNKYKSTFLIDYVTTYNRQASESWLTSVLNDDDALFLPIAESELASNKKLVQNPYYY